MSMEIAMSQTLWTVCALLLAFSGVAFGQACTPPDATIVFAGSASDGYVCGGQPMTAEVPDAGPGATYEWSLAGPYASISAGQGTRTVMVLTRDEPFTNPSNVLRVTVTNACGTTAGEHQFSAIPIQEYYEVSFYPSLTPIGTGPAGCANAGYRASLVFDRSFLSPPERRYLWHIENGTILSDHGTSIDFRAEPQGPLRWSVIQQDRCSALGLYRGHSGTFILAAAVTTSPTVNAPASVRPNSTYNLADLSGWQELLFNGPRLQSLEWSITNGIIQGGRSDMPVDFIAGASGNVTLTATLSDFCGHTFTPSVTIPIGEPPVVLTAPDHMCGNETGMAYVNPAAGAAYNWSVTGGTIASGQGTSSILFMPMAGSTVMVSVTVNVSSASKLIDVIPVPDTTITAASPVAAHSTMTASIPDYGPGAIYAWSITNGTFLGSSNQPEITYLAGEHGSVTLEVSVTSASGCAGSGSLTATIINAPDKRRAVRH
jgi:hypothetical protein